MRAETIWRTAHVLLLFGIAQPLWAISSTPGLGFLAEFLAPGFDPSTVDTGFPVAAVRLICLVCWWFEGVIILAALLVPSSARRTICWLLLLQRVVNFLLDFTMLTGSARLVTCAYVGAIIAFYLFMLVRLPQHTFPDRRAHCMPEHRTARLLFEGLVRADADDYHVMLELTFMPCDDGLFVANGHGYVLLPGRRPKQAYRRTSRLMPLVPYNLTVDPGSGQVTCAVTDYDLLTHPFSMPSGNFQLAGLAAEVEWPGKARNEPLTLDDLSDGEVQIHILRCAARPVGWSCCESSVQCDRFTLSRQSDPPKYPQQLARVRARGKALRRSAHAHSASRDESGTADGRPSPVSPVSPVNSFSPRRRRRTR